MIGCTALVIRYDAFKYFEKLHDFDSQAGFFEYFALHGGFKRLSRFEQSAGDGPETFQRIARPFHQQHFSLARHTRAKNEGPDTWKRMLGILTARRAALL